MLNKISVVILSCILSLTMVIPTSSAIAQSATPEDIYGAQYKPESVSVITQTGQILYQSNDDKVTDPASLTKMMTMYLTFDAIENGDIKASDKIQITPDYEKMSELPNLASVPLEAEQAYTIDQFLRQITLESSNAATLILGEKIVGSTSRFTNQMNDKAKKIGMEHTHFVNPTGADNQLLHQYAPEKYKKERKTQTTSQDMTILMQHLLKDHPEVLTYSSKTKDNQFDTELKTKNLSLKGQQFDLKGADGLKTGTSDEGYSLALTSKRDGLRLNEAILNVKPFPSNKAKNERHKIANKHINKQFDKYEYRKVLSEGEHEINDKTYHVKNDLYDVVPKKMKNVKLNVDKKGKAYVSYKRQFIKGTHAPKVDVSLKKEENKFTAFFKNLFR
ncbi:penicillin-binding protein PBP4 [Staphylococcus nepalensis]|uniref:Penicillin-binding protein PBP4 n=2 Tax=Staphylococcus nepalensis TaxID=214473 RepID=A0ABS3L5S5_9STAP|nr:penicillin-binding protein PBP4 [Staphylococcus nepalensis]MBO1217081.1 penicillin-binding protein PBP4 [Staphylococcus nepalensis]MBO1227759.1 penicillin-binding protein PBP4 [Staphylococcus nepalensis]MBO1235343.1 penicillin-binding protein PBP4 [Staphylococcus nepalensis]MBO1236699.1 penicillin-binding protein PBP4 [Staphylococcus nepalensis]